MKIKNKQNEESILQLQYLAKYSYNKASSINMWILILVILATMLLLLEKFQIQIFISFLITVLNGYKLHNIKKGADAKSYIDRILFNFKSGFQINEIERLKDEALGVIEKNKKDYELKKSHDGTGEIRGIKDWYGEGNKDGLEGIYQCQKENIYWDKKLVKKYVIILLTFLVVSGIGFYFIDKFLPNRTAELLSIFYNMFSTLLFEFKGLLGYSYYSSKIDQTIKIFERITTEKDKKEVLIELQESIEKRRRQPYTIPDILHKINSSKYHKRWENCKVF